MKELTKKELKAIEYVLQGDSFCEATFKAFDCKNKNSAGALSNRVFKKEKVIERLKEAREKVNEKIADKTIKYIDALLKYISIEQIAKKHAENILSNDSRVSDSSIDKALKVIGGYPEQKIGIYRDLEKERELVLTEPDILKIEQGKEREKERLPVLIKESKVKTPPADKV